MSLNTGSRKYGYKNTKVAPAAIPKDVAKQAKRNQALLLMWD